MTVKISEFTTRRIRQIRDLDCEDKGEFVRRLGEDPHTFFEDGNWSRVDFSQTNLSEISFKNAVLADVVVRDDQIATIFSSRPRYFKPNRVISTSGSKLEVGPHSYRSRVSLDTVAYNSRLGAAASFSEFISLLSEMVDAGVVPNVATYTIGITKSENFAQASKLWSRMLDESIAPDIIAYNALLYSSNDPNSISDILKRMQADGHRPDAITYNTYLSKQVDEASLTSALKTIFSEQMIDIVSINTVLTRSANLTRAARVIENGTGLLRARRIERRGWMPNQEFRIIWEYIEKLNLEANSITLNLLISKCRWIDNPLEVLDGISGTIYSPNIYIYNSLISKCSDLSTAEKVLARLISDGLAPSTVTYTAMLGRQVDAKMTIDAFNAYLEEGFEPNSITLDVAVANARSIGEIKQILDLFRMKGIRPRRNTYESALRHGPKTEVFAQDVLNWMVGDNEFPSQESFINLLSNSQNREFAEFVDRQARRYKFPRSNEYFSALDRAKMSG